MNELFYCVSVTSATCRQAEVERRAAVGIIRGPDFPFVCVNDAAADGKAKPHSLLLRGEETLKDLFYFFLRNAAATIGDGYLHRALLQFRSDEQLAFRRSAIGHRFAGIQHQVKQDLLKLDRVANDRWQILREVSFSDYILIDEIVADKFQDVLYHFVQINIAVLLQFPFF